MEQTVTDLNKGRSTENEELREGLEINKELRLRE